MNNTKLTFRFTLDRSLIVLCLAFVLSKDDQTSFVFGQEVKPAPKVTYDDHVKSILVQRCSSCHSDGKKEGDLDVTNYTNLMLGGGSGEVIEAGSADGSYLYNLITHADSPEMPPSGTKIPDPEIKAIADWINMGALENAGSKARISKPKMDLAVGASATVRPDKTPMPLRMPLEPAIKTARPSVTSIATSPWAAVAAIGTPRQVLLYNTQSLELLGVLPLAEGVAHDLKFSRNGSLLLAGGGKDGQSGKAILWNVLTGERVTSVGDELDAVLAADISANHEFIAIGGPNKLVKVIATADGSKVHEIKKHTDWVTALEFSPDGKLLATGDRNGGLHVWEVESGSELYTLKGHSKSITGISWRTDSKILASASEDASIRTWEMNKGKQVKTWAAHGGGTTSVEFLRNGNLATSGRDKLAKTWDQNGKLVKQFKGLPDVTLAVSYCDETNRILCTDWTGTIRIWNAVDAAHVGDLAANPPRLAERLTQSERMFAAAVERHTPLAQQAEQSKAKLTQTSSSLAASKQTRAQTEAKIAAAEKVLSSTKQRFESTAIQHVQWNRELAEKLVAKPLIAAALAKSLEAAKALPADKDLKRTATQLESKAKTIEARVVELNSLVAKSNEEKNTTKAQMDKLAAALQIDKTLIKSLTTQVTQLEAETTKLKQQVATETKAATDAQREVDSAKQSVDKWKSDIAFIGQLKDLNGKLAVVEENVAARQSVVDEAHQKLMQAQAVVDQAKQQKSTTQSEADAIRQQILQLRSGK